MTAFKHTDATLIAGYERAKTLYEGAFDINKLALNTTLVPYWLNDHCFWYRRKTWEGSQFRLVDARKGTNQPVFDHQILADKLSKLIDRPVSADNLPITKVDITLLPMVIQFEMLGKNYQYDVDAQLCTLIEYFVEQQGNGNDGDSHFLTTDMFEMPNKPLSGERLISPDGKKGVFVRDYNLWLEDLENGDRCALTHDGEVLFTYATTPRAMGYVPNAEIQALWSPDSKRLLTVKTDNRYVETTPIVHHVPVDGSLRPSVTTYPHALPGDEYVEEMYMLSIDVDSGKVQSANCQGISVQHNSTHGLFVNGKQAWWNANSNLAYFVDMDKGAQKVRVVEFDTSCGVTRTLFEENSETYIKSGPYGGGAVLLPLQGSQELIWYSERSGWAHLYLYDLNTGALKHPITQGDWLVRDILHFDALRRELWIQTTGRVKGRDPYYQDICRVNIDTCELITVATGDAEYWVLAPDTIAHYMTRYYDTDRFIRANALSPKADYIVTTRSRADHVPVSLLLGRRGQPIMEIETADISGLPSNWEWPEPVRLLAADGKTEIYGAVYRPSDFSMDHCYPVIDFSPNSPTFITGCKGSFRNNMDGGFFYPQAAALAELGFIVVSIDGRGTPCRDTAFSDANYGCTLSSNFIQDRVAGLQQLAARFSYMDINRVGVYTYTGDASELFQYPEFYKTGVYQYIFDLRLSASLFADSSVGQEFLKKGAKFVEQQAEKLQGNLLLIHDLSNRSNPPAATLRIVDALQKANKDFDMLIFPGGVPQRYTFRRSLDYFVKHMHGIDPPKEFSFEAGDGESQ